MKILLQIAAALLILGGIAACTQNDECIGDRFGLWRVTDISVDGKTDETYQGNMFWSFQAAVIQMKTVSENPYEPILSDSYGGCRKDGGKLILDFTNTDTSHPEPGSNKYSPLPESKLPVNSIIELRIISMSGSYMELQYDSPDNTQINYRLKKWD